MSPLVPPSGAWNTPAEGARGERLLFEEFFEAERDRTLRILCVVTGSYAEAEDIAQDAFVRVLERWDSVSAMEDPAAYLHRTAMNLFRDRYRRATVAVKKALGLGPSQDAFGAVDDREVIAQALRTLSPRQRAALVLTELLGYPAEEVGRMLGVKASTVRALNFQGRSALRAAKEILVDG